MYLRRSSAETSEVSTPEDWEDLVNRCVRLRRDEFLIEFRELFERMTAPELPTPSTPSRSTKEELLAWMDQMQKRSLEEPEKGEWKPRDLLAVAERAELRNTGWPIGLVLQGSGKRPVPTPDGIEARLGRYTLGQTEDYWYFHKDGNYYVSRLFEEDLETLQWTSSQGHPESVIWFDIRIWCIAEIILHSATIYRELGITPEEPYYLAINHRSLEGRELYVSNPRRSIWRGRICHSATATWIREVTQDYVTSNLKILVGEVSNNLFTLFDFAEISQEVIDSIVNEFLSRKL